MIELDPDNRQLIIKTKDKENIIGNSDIKLVEYFKATPDKGPYDFEYLKMTLNDGSKYILIICPMIYMTSRYLKE